MALVTAEPVASQIHFGDNDPALVRNSRAMKSPLGDYPVLIVVDIKSGSDTNKYYNSSQSDHLGQRFEKGGVRLEKSAAGCIYAEQNYCQHNKNRQRQHR